MARREKSPRYCWFEVWNGQPFHTSSFRTKAGYFYDEADLFTQLEEQVSPLKNWQVVHLCEPMDYNRRGETLYMPPMPGREVSEEEIKRQMRQTLKRRREDIFGDPTQYNSKYQMVIVETGEQFYAGYQAEAQMPNPYLSQCLQ